MPTPAELIAAIERYEHLRLQVRTRERIVAEALLGRLLRATPLAVEHAGLRYAWSRGEGSIVRVTVGEPESRAGGGRSRRPAAAVRAVRAVPRPRGSSRVRGKSRNVP